MERQEWEAIGKEAMRIDRILWKEFARNKEASEEGLCPENATLWLKTDLETLMCDPEIDAYEVEKRFDSLMEKSNHATQLLRAINYPAVCRCVEIKRDWDAALKSVGKGTMLSHDIGYGFTKQDIRILAELYQKGKHRKKIEDLLEDCNFHLECGKFMNGNCAEFL